MVSLLGDGMANVALIYPVLRVSSSATVGAVRHLGRAGDGIGD